MRLSSESNALDAAIPHHIQRFAGRGSSHARRLGALLRSNRCVLGGALVVSLLIPEAFHPIVAQEYLWARIPPLGDTAGILASLLSLVLAHCAIQRIGSLPLVDEKMAILPTFLASYAFGVALLDVSIGQFGRYHLATSFAAGVGWYFFIAYARARLSAPKLAFVGAGGMESELLLSSIEWVHLREPKLPRDVFGIVFDKQQPVAPGFERLFARAVLRGIPVYESGRLQEMMTGRVLLHLRPEEEFGELFPSQPYLRIRRGIDLVTAVVACLVAMPVIAVFAILIRLESPGPAIYRQVRKGYRGRPFTCYKLRSMRSDIPGPLYTSQADPRITRIGRFIRQSRIDELPQIFNILKGDMGWIGPRPEALRLAQAYDRAIPYYGYRHLVRPGITGWAAVHQGNVALVDAAARKLEYDFYYIKHFSPWLDFLIVLMTVRTVLTGFGSR